MPMTVAKLSDDMTKPIGYSPLRRRSRGEAVELFATLHKAAADSSSVIFVFPLVELGTLVYSTKLRHL